MNYKNREQYKHLMRVLAVAAIVLLECAVFSVFWDRYYASHLWLEPFWDKGNQIIVVIYGIFLLVSCDNDFDALFKVCFCHNFAVIADCTKSCFIDNIGKFRT